MDIYEDKIVRLEQRTFSYLSVVIGFVLFSGSVHEPNGFYLMTAIRNCIFAQISCGDNSSELLPGLFVQEIRSNGKGACWLSKRL